MITATELEKVIESIDLTQTPPTEEPQRQYYFMKKMKEIVKQEEAKKGRKLTAIINTFGCQMNLV